MGCDIHAHVEILLDGKWEHYSAPSIGRRYGLFALMAGVRNYHEDIPLSEPKGLPNDVSPTTLFESECEGSDGHSHSWLSEEEINTLFDKIREMEGNSEAHKVLREFGWLRGNYLNGRLTDPYEYPDSLEGVRLVFWFDN